MQIRINGRLETLTDGAVSLEGIVVRKGLKPERVVIEWNRRIIPRAEWPSIQVQEQDEIEIVSFVGGG